MKETALYVLPLVFLLLVGPGASTSDHSLANSAVPMCAAEIPVGKCTGKINCTACSTCNYCGHCNSGGSCGVCGKRAVRTIPKKVPVEKRRTYTPGPAEVSPRRGSVSEKHNQQRILATPTNNTATSTVYVVTQATSLREYGQAQARVLKRLKEGDEVIVLDTRGKYWWQVSLNGRRGWAKKHLLKQQAQQIYP